MVADSSHCRFSQEICEEMYVSAQERGTGIAKRSPEYIIGKMKAGKAVIAIAEDGRFAGFSYIESWEGKRYVANSGLIVAHAFRGLGLAKRIKKTYLPPFTRALPFRKNIQHNHRRSSDENQLRAWIQTGTLLRTHMRP